MSVRVKLTSESKTSRELYSAHTLKKKIVSASETPNTTYQQRYDLSLNQEK